MVYNYNNRPYAIDTSGVLRELSSWDSARAIYGFEEQGLSNEQFASMNVGGAATVPGSSSGAATSLTPGNGAAPGPIDWGVHVGSGSTLPKWLIPAAAVLGAVLLAKK